MRQKDRTTTRLIRRVLTEEDINLLLSKTLKEWRIEANADHEFSRFQLDEACANQGQRYVNYSDLSALASTYRDACEEELENEKSRIELDIRKNPSKFDIEEDDKGKLRESEVRATVRSQESVQELTATLLHAKRLAKFFNGAVISFDERKTMIVLQGKLVLGNYNSETYVRDKDEDDFREKQAQLTMEREKRRKEART